MRPGHLPDQPVATARSAAVSRSIRSVTTLALLTIAAVSPGCGSAPGSILPDENTTPIDETTHTLIARFVHITDAQLIDEESPGRLTVFGNVSTSAWRPHEAYSTHLLDGTIRAVNQTHAAGTQIDFLIHTGDATDNLQRNELNWFITCFDGGTINPLTGPDDRNPADIPDPSLDPHASFEAQGLYRQNVHGPLPSIPWYSLVGNHDVFAVGVFPIVALPGFGRIAPLPGNHLPLFHPTYLNPIGSVGWAPITPANPGPPADVNFPTYVTPNPQRAYVTLSGFIDAHFDTQTQPPGHGFSPGGPPWYEAQVAEGVTLIGLNTSDAPHALPEISYADGVISTAQVAALRRMLDSATTRGDTIIVATHHPSFTLDPTLGSALLEESFVSLLSEYENVALHLAGHIHRNVVIQRPGYIEMITGAILDPPHDGRTIELWRDSAGVMDVRYRAISHLDEIAPIDHAHNALFVDPLRALREIAEDLSSGRITLR